MDYQIIRELKERMNLLNIPTNNYEALIKQYKTKENLNHELQTRLEKKTKTCQN
jgi:hypothetical protein